MRRFIMPAFLGAIGAFVGIFTWTTFGPQCDCKPFTLDLPTEEK